MDYLVFLIGMFFLAGSVAGLFHHREKPEGGLWLALAGAMAMIAIVCFLQLAGFAFTPRPIFHVFCSIGAGIAMGMLARFLLILRDRETRVAWPVAVVVAAATALAAWHDEIRVYFSVLSLAAGALAGLGTARFLLPAGHGFRKQGMIALTIAGAVATAAGLHPEMVEIAYDVAGASNAIPRLVYLGLLVLGSVAAILWSAFLWGTLCESQATRATHELLRRGRTGSLWIAGAFVLIVGYGGWIARWLGEQAGKEQSELLLSALRIAAASMNGDDLATMQGTPADMEDPDYAAVRQKLLDIRAALPDARFVYTVGLRANPEALYEKKQFVYLVDSEPPESEDFSPPGMVVKEDPAKWLEVKSGRTWFGGPEKDEWGVWFTALVPVLDSSRNSSSILGVDYAAREWLRPLALRRIAAMGATLSAGCLLLGLFAFHRLSQENTLHVAHLSERLTHAMEAADFDAWEWYPALQEMILGQRLASRIGVAIDATRIKVPRFWRHIHPEDRRGLARLLRANPGAAGQTAEMEVRLVGPAGEATWVMLRGRVVDTDPGGKALRVVGTMLNVQDTRRSRGELERQRKFAQHLMESVPSGLAVVDVDGRLTYVNRAFVRMAASETGMLIGQPIDLLLALAAQGDAEGGFEGTMRRSDGSRLPIRAFRAPLSESGGGFILAVIDLTSAKQSEEALLRSRAEARRLALVAQRTDNAVIITDAGGNIEWVNEGFTRMSGYTREDLRQRDQGNFLFGNEGDPSARESMRQRVTEGVGFETELWKYTREGRPYLVRVECQPLKEEDGTLTGFMAIERDVTRERNMEAALAEQRSRMDEINRCLLGLGGDPAENTAQLTRLVVSLFPVQRCQYHQLQGEDLHIAAESGNGPEIPRAAAIAGVRGVLEGQDRFLQWQGTSEGTPGEGPGMLAAQAIEVDGKRRGAIVVRYPMAQDLPADFRSCLALVARALGREEVIAAGRRDLDKTLRGLTVEKTRLDVLLSSIEGGVMVMDAENRTILASEGMGRIFGLDPAGLIGRPGSELAGTLAGAFRDGERFMRRLREIAAKGDPVTGEDLELRNGMILARDFVPIRDGETVYGALWHYRDVTRVRRSARLLEAVASISSTLLSPKMRDTHWAEVLEVLGRATAVDRAYIFRQHPHLESGLPAMSQLAEWNSGAADPQIHNPDLQDVAFGDCGYQRWYDVLSEGGEIAGLVASLPAEERPLLVAQEIKSLAVVPIFAGSEFWGFLGFDACFDDRLWEKWELALLRSAAANIGLRMVVQKDSDALLRARDDARQAALAAEEANRAKSTFLATMSHEIRTPLNAVIGMASLLETTPLSNQQQDYAETILRSSHFLLELINDVLDYSRIESGRIDLDATVFSLGEICREAFDVVRAAALGKQLELVCRLSPDLPARVLGDPGRLRQILVNLLGNAVKFTAKGQVTLDADGTLEPDGQWRLRMRVTDTGIGIAPESLGRLFEPFIQGDSSTTRRFGGSGLGLAISRRLAQLMGGDIRVESVAGQGSTFTVEILLMPTAGQVAGRAGSGVALPADPQGRRVLVVDDNELNRRVMEEMLAEEGMSSKLATSGREAIAAWNESGPFDLVITDYYMPDLDGAGLARELRGLPGGDKAKFALVSSGVDLPASEQSLFHSILAKPLWPKPFHGMIAELLPRSASPTISPTAGPPDRQTAPAGGFEGLRVLVAEDNPNNQKVVRLLLRRLGIEPTIVENGQLAVEAVGSAVWDVLLLDIQMPVMDGLEASRRINALGDARPPVIIALTANAFKEDREAAIAAGMDHYLAKPVTLARLREVLAEVTAGHLPAIPPPPQS